MPVRVVLLVGVAFSAGSIALLLRDTGVTIGLERQTIDARFVLRGPRPPGPVAIVALDQKSLGSFNARPPIRRSYYAHLLDRLRSADPALLAVDVQFIGASSDDRALLAAIARDRPILLATHDSGGQPLAVPGGRRDASGVLVGSAAIEQDADGIVRRMLYAPVALPTFAVRAAELIQGNAVGTADFPGNHAWIDYRGSPGTFRTYSFVDVLAGQVPSDAFRGKAVLVGVTDPLEKDVFATPISSNPMSGVEVQANALMTILDRLPLRPVGSLANIVLLLVCGAFPAAMGLRLPALAVLATAFVGGAGLLLSAQEMFNAGRIIDVVAPGVALAIASAGTIATDSYVERRQRVALERAIGRPLTPRNPAAFFISYRRDQSGWPAAALKTALTKEFGANAAFMDTESIVAGTEWPRRIEEAIRGCSVMLVLIGPYWLVRTDAGARRLDDPHDRVRLEIEAGLTRRDIAVVPVLIDGARCHARAISPSR